MKAYGLSTQPGRDTNASIPSLRAIFSNRIRQLPSPRMIKRTGRCVVTCWIASNKVGKSLTRASRPALSTTGGPPSAIHG